MALDKLPKDQAAIAKRAKAFPTHSAGNVALDEALATAVCKQELRLLPPVTKIQQRVQTKVALLALESHDKLLVRQAAPPGHEMNGWACLWACLET